MRALTQEDLELLRLPSAYWNAAVTQAPPDIVDRMVRYAHGIVGYARQPLGLYLHGPPGHGKTTLAAALLKQARMRGLAGLFVSVPEYTEGLRAKDRTVQQHDLDTTVVERMKGVDYLVLDGIRAVDLESPWFGVSGWEAVLRHRGDHKRATVLTSQLSHNDFALQARALAVALTGVVVPVPVKGTDWRAEAQRRAMDALKGAG